MGNVYFFAYMMCDGMTYCIMKHDEHCSSTRLIPFPYNLFGGDFFPFLLFLLEYFFDIQTSVTFIWIYLCTSYQFLCHLAYVFQSFSEEMKLSLFQDHGFLGKHLSFP